MTHKADFLPDGYQVPNNAKPYTKLEQGLTVLRILESPILGYEGWVEVVDEQGKPQRKVVRKRKIEEIPAEIDKKRHFWAVIVYNYKTKKIEVWNITQKGIMDTLRSLSLDEDWGSPINYDIKITKEGEGLDTTYFVSHSPIKPLSEEVKAAYIATPINLKALYATEENPYGGDPFSTK